jgi:hypothetical protein
MRAYKFMPAEFVGPFLAKGSLKIGSIEEYRIADGKSGGRSDELEGIIRFEPGPRVIEGEQLLHLCNAMGLDKPHPNMRFSFEDGATISMHSTGYLFCASGRLTKLLVKRMREDFGCDSCVRIDDVAAFAQHVTAAHPDLQVPFRGETVCWGADHVIYRNVKQNAVLPDGDIWTKRPEYAWQQEVRIAWPGRAPHQSFVVDVPAVVKSISAVDLSVWR